MTGRAGVFVLLLALCAGCVNYGPAKTPIDQFYYRSANPARTLLVLLPGAKDRPDDFQRRGFIDALRKSNSDVDIVSVNAHWGYYRQHRIVERLRLDVIAPAQAKGYQQIWLAGISLGGWGSLLYAREHAADLAGIILLAPFLSEDKIISEVRNAGGLEAWRPGTVHPQDDQRQTLLWLQQNLSRAPRAPKLYLGFGSDDRFAEANGLLAARLPREQVFVAPGGHNWKVWTKLWNQILREQPFSASNESRAALAVGGCARNCTLAVNRGRSRAVFTTYAGAE